MNSPLFPLYRRTSSVAKLLTYRLPSAGPKATLHGPSRPVMVFCTNTSTNDPWAPLCRCTWLLLKLVMKLSILSFSLGRRIPRSFLSLGVEVLCPRIETAGLADAMIRAEGSHAEAASQAASPRHDSSNLFISLHLHVAS